jgi:DnaJ-class molecular chaperone
MQLENHYRLLNIEKSADLKTIKKAFRAEISLYHSDNKTSEGDRVRFDLLVEGFDILSNLKKRDAYDKMLFSTEKNKPVRFQEPKQEEQYRDWKKESQKKSQSYWDSSLSELLVLDLFLDSGISGPFSGTDELLDGIGDSLNDLFDIF